MHVQCVHCTCLGVCLIGHSRELLQLINHVVNIHKGFHCKKKTHIVVV